MSRIGAVQPEQAEGKTKQLLDAVNRKLGLVPNMTRAMAASPAVLESYLGFAGTIGGGKLGAKLGELIALTVAETNGCDYCLSAHTAIGGLMKIAPADLEAARDAASGDARIAAALAFARRIAEARGHVGDADIAAARAAGFSDGELGEIVAHVALNFFTNLFNSVAATEIEFPRVSARLRKAA